MSEETGLFYRHAERMAVEALTDTRVVVVNGARQVGKCTLAELIAARSACARELFLDDQAVRAAAEADPSAFVRHDGLLMIDEIQRVPELLLAIKREVDRDPRPGRFLLTGSARLLGLRDLPDALPVFMLTGRNLLRPGPATPLGQSSRLGASAAVLHGAPSP